MVEGGDARILGVDVGGTKVAVAELQGAAAVGTVEHPTDISSSEALLDGVESAAREVIGSGPPPAAVGIGVPSQVDWASGAVIASVNIPLEGVPLREELGRRLGA